jgi:hypothetical protein
MGKPKIDLSQFINSYKSGNFKGYNNNNNIKSKSVDEKQINYYNSITKKYSKSLNFIYNSHIEAINTQFINYRRFINKKKYTYESFINNSYYLNDFKNAKKRNFSAQNIRAKNIKEKQLLKFEKVLAILKKKIYSYKQLFFKKILYYIKRNDILPNVNKYCEYEISNEKFGNKNKAIKQLEDLEVKAYNNLKIFKTFIESNLYLLSNSNIITDPEEIKYLYEEIQKADKQNQIEKNKKNKDFIPKSCDFVFKLIYRATRDGDDASDFHKRCDEIGPNVTLVKSEKNKRFGGFTFCNWSIPQKYLEKMKSNAGILKQDQYSFCFSLDLKKMYYHDDRKGKEDAIFCSSKFGPTFCSNIFAINNNMLTKGGYCTRKKTSCFKGQSKDYEISGEKSFNIKELEVYEIVYL